MTRKVSILAGVFALMASPALAHHPGGASNTGGAGPIVTISASTLEAGQIPIVNEMNGLQSKTGYRLFTGIAYAF